jgi:GMP synthase-like glutamine amidotransferase
MKRVLFIQHGDVDKPGLLAEALDQSGVGLEVFHAWRDGDFPDLEEFQGLALGGGGQSAWEVEKYPYLDMECMLVRGALERGIPVLGLCLGAQLIARATGAEVRRAERKEIGFFPLSLTPWVVRIPSSSPFQPDSRPRIGMAMFSRFLEAGCVSVPPRSRPTKFSDAVGALSASSFISR